MTVDTNGHCISIDDGDEGNAVLLAASTTTRIVSSQGGAHGYVVARDQNSLLRPSHGRRRANAGLQTILAEAARRAHVRIGVTRSGHCPPLPLPQAVHHSVVVDARFPRFVAENLRGLVRLGNGVQPEDVITSIVAAYPSTRIAILGTHRPQLRRIREEINRRQTGHRVVGALPADDEGAWIATSSFVDAGRGPLEKCHVVIVVDAVHATHLRAEAELAKTDARFRLVGILPGSRRLSPSQSDVLTAVFGIAVLDVPAIDREFAEVRVTRIDVNAPTVPTATTGMVLRRRGYWHHAARNRRLARVAQALRAGNAGAPARVRGLADWLAGSPRRVPNVVVLVDDVEHALVLARLLPDWPVAADEDGVSLNLRGLSQRHRELLTARRNHWLAGGQQIICQHVASTLHVVPDVVLWAGGGPHGPSIPWGWLVHPVRAERHRLLLVDVTDRHHSELAEWSDDRAREYEERDWFAFGRDDEAGRVDRFLRQRPPVRSQRRPRRRRSR